MANNRTITSANAILMLGVVGLYDTPRRIQGFSADDLSNTDALTTAETSFGIDGRLSAGWVFNAVVQNIMLQADSESIDFFENWTQAERQRRETYIAFGSLLIKATSKRYTMTRGFKTASSVMPSLRRTIQPRQFSITWQDVTAGPA